MSLLFLLHICESSLNRSAYFLTWFYYGFYKCFMLFENYLNHSLVVSLDKAQPAKLWVLSLDLLRNLGKSVNLLCSHLLKCKDFPDASALENPSAWNAGDSGGMGSTPGSGRASGGNDSPVQYSCLENPMDRGAWWATVHGASENWTQLSN